MVPFREIWDGLRVTWGARFSEEVIRRHTPSGEVSLLECPSCGVQFFDPSVAGDAGFYRELGTSPRYYSPWKWEFDWVKARLAAGAAVLDVGCGSGDFLAHVAPKVRRAAGLEYSLPAVAAARARGLEVLEGGLAERAADFEGSCDAVCAFHVLEHAPDPVSFLGLMRRCLRPGGFVFLSVPNRFRSGRLSFEPLDCPPHHLTRWSPAALEAFVRRAGLAVVETASEPVDVAIPRERLRERVRAAAEKIPGAGRVLGKWLPPLAWRLVLSSPLAALYRRTGILERAGFHGFSVAVRCGEVRS